jgi:hypothetical protein
LERNSVTLQPGYGDIGKVGHADAAVTRPSSPVAARLFKSLIAGRAAVRQFEKVARTASIRPVLGEVFHEIPISGVQEIHQIAEKIIRHWVTEADHQTASLTNRVAPAANAH